ncbi:6-phosphofructo-2-kinase-domain-containing protein [Lipomyces tetrasporus]|uniref:6-phosphofructo-2-kinase-domain-containing protein n=1 Tax=Lipomyces tetrasporus TaxID=54092 RepID=A0AAD7QLG8_9ASCO|nr:6-phosphofructo-2-kinase-domain-containing protein [Lipomyces tetrasporus]KAJ8097319.1 6-phosphofructo-2-kinase-domain-containing protein [Lipomyces tetrasporus]
MNSQLNPLPLLPPSRSVSQSYPTVVRRTALTDTPLTSTPSSPRGLQANDGYNIPPSLELPRRATTLDVPGLTSSRVSPDGTIAARDVGSKLVIVMVGLPARGKSYITKKLARYMNWLQHETKIFNVGNTRRQSKHHVGPASHPLPDSPVLEAAAGLKSPPPVELDTSHAANFFAPDNPQTAALRESWALQTLDELLDWVLHGNGSIGILDATNSTVKRRRTVLNRVKDRSNGELKVLFLESVCDDKELLEQNIRLKLSGPDYKGQDPEIALADFRMRVKNYEKTYETIGDEEEKFEGFQYVKMIDVGRKVVAYNTQGFLAGQAVFFLLNFNLAERQIWITRHGESEDNILGKLGGDASLSPKGVKYAKALARFMDNQRSEFRRRQLERFSLQSTVSRISSQPTTPKGEPVEPHFCVWTSMLKRSIETAKWFDEDTYDIKQMRMLNELGSGICDGMTYEEIRQKFPKEYEARVNDKIGYRYPGVGGESYLDVINRLRPVIVEVERMQDHVLLIGHRVVARVLLAYFMNLGRQAIGDLDVPLNTLWVLEPKPYGVYWAVYQYDENKDWFYKIENSNSLNSTPANNTPPPEQTTSSTPSDVASPEAALPLDAKDTCPPSTANMPPPPLPQGSRSTNATGPSRLSNETRSAESAAGVDIYISSLQ